MLGLFDGLGGPPDRQSSRGGSLGCSLHLYVGVGGLFDEVEVGVVLSNHCSKHRARDRHLLCSEGRERSEMYVGAHAHVKCLFSYYSASL